MRTLTVFTSLLTCVLLACSACSSKTSSPDGSCGDGELSPSELCDGNNLRGQTCETLGHSGGTLTCSTACTFDTTNCTSDRPPGCGNGVLDTGEVCDGTVFGGLTCSDFGADSGILSCVNCDTIDTSLCVFSTPQCGNNIKEHGEECDGTDIPACSDVGFLGGVTKCNSDCTLDTSLCNNNTNPICGNGIVEVGEECDDGNFQGCDGCNPNCRIERCGNGVIECGEECDDGNTNSGDGCGAACLHEECGNGYVDYNEECDDGNTVSGDGCSSSCVEEVCGNGVLDAGEECDDGNAVDHDGCSSGCQTEYLQWVYLPPSAQNPPAFTAPLICEFDYNLQKVVCLVNSQTTMEMWLFDTQWTKVTNVTLPSPRTAFGLTFDYTEHLLILTGGISNQGTMSDTWVFDGSTWTEYSSNLGADTYFVSPPWKASTLFNSKAYTLITYFSTHYLAIFQQNGFVWYRTISLPSVTQITGDSVHNVIWAYDTGTSSNPLYKISGGVVTEVGTARPGVIVPFPEANATFLFDYNTYVYDENSCPLMCFVDYTVPQGVLVRRHPDSPSGPFVYDPVRQHIVHFGVGASAEVFRFDTP